MSDANVLQALDNSKVSYKRPALSNILIYGRVRCVIEKPNFIGDGLKETEGYFALVDAYALKCLGDDYFREGTSYDVNSIYFTKGSILIYINSREWVGKDVKIFGKNKSYGTTIRRQETGNREEGISAFVFGPPVSEPYKRKSVYPIIPNVLVELNSRDPDAKGTVLEDFIVSIASNRGEIPYPETLDSIIPYTGVNNYIEISNNVVENEEQEQVNDTNGITNEIVIPKVKPSSSVVKNNSGTSGDRIDISKIDMHLTFHLDGKERPDFFDSFKEDISSNALKRRSFEKKCMDGITELYSYDCADSVFDYNSIVDDINNRFIDRVASVPTARLGGYSGVTVKKFLDEFIDNCSSSLDSTGDNEEDTASSLNVKNGIEKLKKLVLSDSSVLRGNSGDYDIDKIPMLGDKNSFFVNVVGVCTGVGYDALEANYKYCISRGLLNSVNWIYALLKCPYVLGLVGVRLSLVDCDIIKYSFGKLITSSTYDDTMYRNYLVLLDTLNNCSEGNYSRSGVNNEGVNTFILKSKLMKADSAYPKKALKYLDTVSNRFMGSPDIRELLELLLNKSVRLSAKDIGVIDKKDWYTEESFEALYNAGVINTLDDFCGLERKIEQEFLIYEVFEKMGKMPTGIEDDVIEEVISNFEKDRGFSLEGLQREGIKLCKYRAGVLSGCAGSGKTTTSDCMTEVLKTLGNVNIIYCTPTGKACRRLAEVVHSTVKTIHSQFNVMLGGGSYLQGAYSQKKSNTSSSDTQTIYILDEMAMCNTELMSNIARKVSENDMIYFLGDVKQLPPIGGGCPFKVLMEILPCVELGVSKRAAEGSLVNYNTSLINFMSDGYNCTDLLYDGITFIAEDCSDESIASVVRKVFNGFIDGSLNGTKYSEDDIQVITGYQSKMKMSSTVRLNKPIQNLLRSKDRVLYYKESRISGSDNEPFYMNDRVIYVNRNSYDICRYVLEDGVFRKVLTFGCVNGEMGKLVGVIKSSEARIDDNIIIDAAVAGKGYYSNISDDELNAMKDRYLDKEDKLRSDSSFTNDGYYFVVIRVYDSDLRRDVYALLRGKGRYVGEDLCLSGSDLNNLSLAYALTCHKMQGSQSKVVVAVFESTGSPNFMNRNMINTIITRSQGIVCCVGSVTGEDSMINKGRKVVSKTDCRDILSVMSGHAEWVEG